MTYTPDSGFVGTDIFQYTVQDASNAVSNQATVTVTVTKAQAPTTVDDQATTKEGTALSIAVLANDSNPGATIDPTSVAVVVGAIRN